MPREYHAGSLIGMTPDKVAAFLEADYPPEVHEEIRWLIGWVHERAAGSFAKAARLAKLAGWDTSETTISKLCRGKGWKRQEDGTFTGLSVTNMVDGISTLRRQVKIDDTKGTVGFIETPTWHQVHGYINARRAKGSVCRMGAVVGHTGSQKTACFKEFMGRYNHGQTILMQAPTGAYEAKLKRALAAKLRVGSTLYIESRIQDQLSEGHTLIVDNAQFLYSRKHQAEQPAFNFLLTLQEETGCTIILSFTPQFRDEFEGGYHKGYFEQFVGRFGGMHEMLVLPEYPSADDLLTIAEAFEFRAAKTHLPYLKQLSRKDGRIRILFNDLQKGRKIATLEEKPFTIDHLKMAHGSEEAA